MYISCTNMLSFFTCSIPFKMISNINLKMIFEADKLTGPNYVDWLRNLKRVLRSEKLDYVMERSVPPTLLGMPHAQQWRHSQQGRWYGLYHYIVQLFTP